jgi:hypothetical protein
VLYVAGQQQKIAMPRQCSDGDIGEAGVEALRSKRSSMISGLVTNNCARHLRNMPTLEVS